MTIHSGPAGFHSGELAAQRQAGVETEAARLAPMVARGQLTRGKAVFLAEVTFGAMTARDRTGRLWTSPLVGPPGFVEAASPATLDIKTPLPTADPLHGLAPGQPVGVIAIDFSTRRRLRINGVLTSSAGGGMTVDVDQAYGNCPKYIHPRRVEGTPNDDRSRVYAGNTLRPTDIRIVEAADTFFLGTTHVTAGNDASHRGGPAGFVRVEQGRLSWPDFPGNNMFNSFGNLSLDPAAALLFVDFRAGITLQLSGSATVGWAAPAPDDDTATGRRIEFVPERVIATALTALTKTVPS